MEPHDEDNLPGESDADAIARHLSQDATVVIADDDPNTDNPPIAIISTDMLNQSMQSNKSLEDILEHLGNISDDPECAQKQIQQVSVPNLKI